MVTVTLPVADPRPDCASIESGRHATSTSVHQSPEDKVRLVKALVKRR